jgi:hypothetical protein
MGIFESDSSSISKAKLAEIDKMTVSALFVLKHCVTQGFNLVWKSQDATPQEVILEAGTNAVKMLEASAAAQKLIKKLDPTWEYLIPQEWDTIKNTDGTATVVPKPPADPV